jgi:hypothetical protein
MKPFVKSRPTSSPLFYHKISTGKYHFSDDNGNVRAGGLQEEAK